MSEKVALYIRKSRDEENSTKEETLHTQQQTLINICEAKGYQYKTTDIYKEVESSIKADRPELIKLMKGMEQGKYTRLLITHIDRLGRDIGLLDDLKKLCAAHNIIIETPDNTINFKDDNHDLMYGFSSVLADFEYKRIRHRLATGKVNTVALRNKWMGSSPPFGYLYDKNDKILKPHPEQSKVFRKMVEYLLEGYTFSQVAETLNDQGYRTQLNNKWTAGRIMKLVKNRTFLGEAEFNSTRLDKYVKAIDCHEALLTEEEYNTIQQLAFSRRNYGVRTWGKIKTELDGLLYCGVCKRGLTVQLNKKHSEKRGDWTFYSIRNCYHLMEDGEKCPNCGCKVDIIYELVLEELQEYKEELLLKLDSLEGSDISSSIDLLKEKINNLNDQIKKANSKISKLTELYLDEIISREEHDKRRVNLNDTKTSLTNEINFLENKLKNMDLSQIKKTYENAIELIMKLEVPEIPIAEKNKVLKVLLKRVEVTKETLQSNPSIHLDYQN